MEVIHLSAEASDEMRRGPKAIFWLLVKASCLGLVYYRDRCHEP